MSISNDEASKRMRLFSKRAADLGLARSARLINEALTDFESNGKWDWKRLDNALRMFFEEASSLDESIKNGILILDEIRIKLEEKYGKVEMRTERDVFSFTTFAFEESDRIEKSLSIVHECVDFLLNEGKSKDK